MVSMLIAWTVILAGVRETGLWDSWQGAGGGESPSEKLSSFLPRPYCFLLTRSLLLSGELEVGGLELMYRVRL
jgi:hypothetical protein